MIKNTDQSQLGLHIHITFHCLGEAGPEFKQDRNPETGAEADCGGMLLTGLFLYLTQPALLYSAEPLAQGWPSHRELGPHINHESRNGPHSLANVQSDGSMLSIDVVSSQVMPAS